MLFLPFRPARLHPRQTLLALALAAAGCATPHRCPEGANDVYCASMKDTYGAARAGGGNENNVLGDEHMRGGSGKADAGRLDIPGGRHNLAGPVYHQAKPFRLWVAPWTDANGIMHSGEYLYFTTPGMWSYGPLDMPGSAGGILGPGMPDDLGFTPAPPQTGSAAPRTNKLTYNNGQSTITSQNKFNIGGTPPTAVRPEDQAQQQPDPTDPNSITKPEVRMTGTTDPLALPERREQP